MKSNSTIAPEKKKSVHALEATNFFLADVQTGLGPFLAAYLAGAGWEPGRVGMALTIGGIITVVLQAPAGAIVDQLRSKRLILVLASVVLAFGAVLLSITAAPWAVYTSQVLIGGSRAISWSDTRRRPDGDRRHHLLRSPVWEKPVLQLGRQCSVCASHCGR